jgi:signal transduction histidine kinase
MRAVPLRTPAGGAVVSHVDITPVRRSELELQSLRRDLAHLSRVSTMGQLSTALAHELNQPLGAILSNAEAAEMLLDADPPALDQVREILTDIRQDDERAGEVIRRMRALLRKEEMRMAPLDIGVLVPEILRLVSSEAAMRKVSFRVNVAPGPLPVRGDRVHLQQVMLNLILNAMDAAAESHADERRVVVEAGRNQGGDIEVAVSDNGPGIPPKQLARLFEPFFSTKPQGMGIGTSIARTIIQAHQGRIWAENNPVEGATLRFTLPVDDGGKSEQHSSLPRAAEPKENEK